jgi:flavin-binding protein dodecin
MTHGAPAFFPSKTLASREQLNLLDCIDFSHGAACAKYAIFLFLEDSAMPENVYKVIELIGTSPDSWEKAAAAAVERASHTLRDLRVAEVVELDLAIENGKVSAYRAKLSVSFKYEDHH